MSEELARKVLAAKDRYALLSLGSDVPIVLTNEGYCNVEDEDVRRAYMKIATRIHPDKLTAFKQATEAFQKLVRAYELVCKPDQRADESDDSRDDDDDDGDGDGDGDNDDNKDGDSRETEDSSEEEDSSEDNSEASPRGKNRARTSLARCKPAAKPTPAKPTKPAAKPRARAKKKAGAAAAAAAEMRTCVRCPRCHAEWGEHLKGESNEAAYTEFMRGVRQVHCLTCLFEFGALTAGHGCPACKRSFEYRPNKFGKVHVCPDTKERGKKKCGISFRAKEYLRSAAAQQATDAELERAAAERRRKEEAAESRRARGAERQGADSDDAAWLEELGQFIVTEDCPRCGKQFTTGHKAHLLKCKPCGGKRGGSGGGGGGGALSKKRKAGAGSFIVGRYDDASARRLSNASYARARHSVDAHARPHRRVTPPAAGRRARLQGAEESEGSVQRSQTEEARGRKG